MHPLKHYISNLRIASETPEEYDSRNGTGGGHYYGPWDKFMDRCRWHIGVLAALFVIVGVGFGFVSPWANIAGSIFSILLYRLSRWQAWERP